VSRSVLRSPLPTDFLTSPSLSFRESNERRKGILTSLSSSLQILHCIIIIAGEPMVWNFNASVLILLSLAYLMGDNDDNWSTQPFLMTEGGSNWIPPPLTRSQSRSSHPSDNIWNRNESGGRQKRRSRSRSRSRSYSPDHRSGRGRERREWDRSPSPKNDFQRKRGCALHRCL
jgi:hypothetical protein